MNIETVGVVGAGTMGNGIAHVFAQNGYHVRLVDVSQDILDRALQTIRKNLERQAKKAIIQESEIDPILSRIQTATDVEAMRDAQLVVEAVVENVDVKRELFQKLDAIAAPEAILASNTSSISITEIAAATQRPQQVVGMHFFNPVPVMKLVEVIRGLATSDETFDRIMELSRKLGKEPVAVNDYPGFVSNRVLMPMINEAI